MGSMRDVGRLCLALLADATMGVSQALFTFTNLWWLVFAPLTRIFAAYLIGDIRAFLEGHRKRAEVRHAFGPYVSSVVIEKMLVNDALHRKGMAELSMRIGTHTGMTVVGNMG